MATRRKGNSRALGRLVQKPDKVPEGFFTSRDWAAREKISLGHAQKLLTELLYMKKAVRRYFRITVDGSPCRIVAHYKTIA